MTRYLLNVSMANSTKENMPTLATYLLDTSNILLYLTYQDWTKCNERAYLCCKYNDNGYDDSDVGGDDTDDIDDVVMFLPLGYSVHRFLVASPQEKKE